MRVSLRPHLAVLCTNIFFAVNYSMVKTISPKLVGPYGLNVLRVGVSMILMWAMWMFGKTHASINKKDVGRFILCGLTGIAINQMLFIKGLTMTSTIHATLLMLVTPIVITVFAIWALKEKFTIYKAFGLSLGIAGAVFLILQKEASQHASDYLLGDMLIIGNAISYSVYFILVKPLMKNYSALHVMRWIFTIGFFMVLPIGWQQAATINWNGFHWHDYVSLFSITVLGTFLAYFFNAYGLQKLGAGVTGAYIYTQPVFVTIIAVLFVGETLSWQKILAACFIFGGVYLVSFKKGRNI